MTLPNYANYAGGSSVLNVTVEQIRIGSVYVGWIPPFPAPARGYQIVTTGTNTTVAETTHVLTLPQDGNYTVQVLPIRGVHVTRKFSK